MKRPIFILNSKDKSKEQLKAEAQRALRKYLDSQKKA
jgi:hypothetical protein